MKVTRRFLPSLPPHLSVYPCSDASCKHEHTYKRKSDTQWKQKMKMELERPRLVAVMQRAMGGARMARFLPVRGSIKRKIFALLLHGVALFFRDHPELMSAPAWVCFYWNFEKNTPA
ncbi:hypothetical protein BT93_F3124 [Corymbia citriodora subsp. variegata]|nr:hypothetical protein BT93_F3124 [Corymbia citriodora subsp. variegata]